MPSKTPDVYQIKLELKWTTLPIWRRVEVPCDITLAHFHELIQDAMGWEDCHMHEFVIDGKRYGPASSGQFGEKPHDERKTRLNKVAGVGTTFSYCYDFGDNWDHEIVIEGERTGTGARLARCLAGANAGPPEDCGGPAGYDRMLEILADPGHEEYEEMQEWMGDVDPRVFDVSAVDEWFADLKV